MNGISFHGNLPKLTQNKIPTSMTGLEMNFLPGLMNPGFQHLSFTYLSGQHLSLLSSARACLLRSSEGSRIWSFPMEVQKFLSQVSICNTQNSLFRICIQLKAPWATTQVTCPLPALEGHWQVWAQDGFLAHVDPRPTSGPGNGGGVFWTSNALCIPSCCSEFKDSKQSS